MQHYRLIGYIESPIVTNWSKYQLHYKDKLLKIGISKFDCGNDLFRPYNTFAIKKDYGKISVNNRPYVFNCFMGYIHLDIVGEENDLNEILSVTQLGKFRNEGMGMIHWFKWFKFTENRFDEIKVNKPQKVYLKKLNMDDIEEQDYKLLTACLIHDLVYIKNKHNSKLWGYGISIKEDEIAFIVYNHHNKIKHPLIKRLQIADQKASMITRQKESSIKNYLYSPIRKGYEDLVDLQMFKKIKGEIEERLTDFRKLYDYIWNCKELDYLVEAQNYPQSSLRKHLLLTTQFALG